MASARRKAPEPEPQARSPDAREKVAFFLGAGASKAFGYPLTSEYELLFPDAVAYHADGIDTFDIGQALN